MNEYVTRELAERILGRRACRKHFGDSERISVCDFLRACIHEGIGELSGRTLSRVVGVKARTLREWVRRGKIRGRERKGVWYYDLGSVLRHLGGGEEILEYQGRRYRILAVITSRAPCGAGEIVENREFVRQVLRRERVGYELVVRRRT